MDDSGYLMESEEESIRLEAKTDPAIVGQQAIWAEIRPGARVADLGCGCGKTTFLLHQFVQPGGTAMGVDLSEKRLEYANENYASEGIEFVRADLLGPLEALGSFDFVWIRFVLEYFRSNAAEIVRNASGILKPGGTMCLIDLDYNCLSHFGLPERLERALARCARILEDKFNFDPYAGRKLYSYLYDLGYKNIAASVSTHHLIYGSLNDADAFNFAKKIEMVSRSAGLALDEYKGGSVEFIKEFTQSFSDPRRFSYTPLISVRGQKPSV